MQFLASCTPIYDAPITVMPHPPRLVVDFEGGLTPLGGAFALCGDFYWEHLHY